MFSVLVILFTLVPALEIYLLFKVGGEIGGLNTMMVVIITGVLGAALAKSQGIQILTKIQNDAQKGGLPTNQLIQGLMVFAGGLLLLTPGFMTDIFGFSLVMPGTRHLLMIWVKRLIANSIKSGNFQFNTFGGTAQGASSGFYSFTNSSEHGHTSVVEDELFEQEETQRPTLNGDIIEAEFKHKD